MTQQFQVTAAQVNQTLAALLRQWLPGQSWSAVRQIVAARRVRINGELWLDPARRLKEGDTVALSSHSAPKPRQMEDVVLRYLDDHIVVVEKPAGVSTVRHPSERDWPAQRRELAPTLDDLTQQAIIRREGRVRKHPLSRLRIVQRLDKETSGLVVFARSPVAERELGKQFRDHTVIRRYLALVPGFVSPRTIQSHLVRDRGDGRRGSTTFPLTPTPLPQGRGVGLRGKEAITHVEVVEKLNGYTLLACRLETGRTHQIRIHLAELGHPICGEKVYQRKFGEPPQPDPSGAPRLALHATELGFVHPVSAKEMHWTMPLPPDLQGLVDRWREKR